MIYLLSLFFFNPQSHCENNTLTCEACTTLTTAAPTLAYATFTTIPMTTMMPEGTCDRAMDLVFLLDGSTALSETEFQTTKEFILGVVERFRLGSAHTRAAVLLYYSGVKTYDLQVCRNFHSWGRYFMHYSSYTFKIRACSP